MPESIEIKIDDVELQKVLGELISKSQNIRPLMKNISGIMLDSVEENFEKEDRPDKWQELAKSTIKQRKKKGHWPGRILQVRGDLASSITSYYDSNSALVGTNKVYATIHQFGDNVGRGKKVKIPARPYLVIDNKNIKIILVQIKEYLD